MWIIHVLLHTLQINVNTFPESGEATHHFNGAVYANDGSSHPLEEPVYYEAAGPKYHILERESEQSIEEAEASYEAILQRECAATSRPTDIMVVESSSGSMTSSYDNVLAVFRNSVRYRSPPNHEEEIYSTLKQNTYVHLDRKSISTKQQIGSG